MNSLQARFAASEDHCFQPVGSQTKIPYQEDYEFYFRYLHEGLQARSPSVLDIFDTWNAIFYPCGDNGVKNITGSVREDLSALITDLHTEGAQAIQAEQLAEQPDNPESRETSDAESGQSDFPSMNSARGGRPRMVSVITSYHQQHLNSGNYFTEFIAVRLTTTFIYHRSHSKTSYT